MQINENLIKYNFSSRKNTPIKYIVIHDTGNTGYKADANAHYNYFNTGDRQASAHYFVDDKQILRVVKDSNKSWHCGDGLGKYGITNENSIGIEICINKDGDYNKAVGNTLYLVKYLMNNYNIGIDNVVRHYDASRKCCPNTMSQNNWLKWTEFKNKLKSITNDNNTNSDPNYYTTYIINLYYKLLNRQPDPSGLSYWKNRIKNNCDLGQFVIELFNSDEYKKIN